MPPKPSAMLSALAATPRIIMRVASVTSACCPIASAANGNASKAASAATGRMVRRNTPGFSSCMAGEQSLGPHEQHDRHDEIDAHGGNAGRQRIGFGIVHHHAHDLRQEGAQARVDDADE